MANNEHVPMKSLLVPPAESAHVRKSRGAFFTPEPLAAFVSEWAIRSPTDRVMEPSAGDAAFLVQAVRRLQKLGVSTPEVAGVEIHEPSVRQAQHRVKEAGGVPVVLHSDFFLVEPGMKYTAVIGNPPYIRYQDFTGESRTRSRAAALQSGVALTGLASSWAAFTIQSTRFLETGGRLGLVLPAELLSVNYAAPVRQFLFDRFRSVALVLFTEQVFPEAEADVLLLLADGFDEGPTDHATIYQARDANDLASPGVPQTWTPPRPSDKWTSLLLSSIATEPLEVLRATGDFTQLDAWGDTTLGMVTGNNAYFALSPERVRELALGTRDLLPLSPPGSAHLRGLALSKAAVGRLGRAGKATYLFRPPEDRPLSPNARAYVDAGHLAGVDQAYKCRVRSPWYRVPLLKPADLFLTYMNADAPRLTTNEAGVHHLNSVHGVYLSEETRDLGRELLPVASLNSLTLLSAEMIGRSYGGGILKVEPREADGWLMPAAPVVASVADDLRRVKPRVVAKLQAGKLLDAVALVDAILLLKHGLLSSAQLSELRDAHLSMSTRRATRGQSGR